METVPVKALFADQFRDRYPEAYHALWEGELSDCEEVPAWVAEYVRTANEMVPRFGEVKVPGYGWHGCVMDGTGRVTHFHSDDDGWQEAP